MSRPPRPASASADAARAADGARQPSRAIVGLARLLSHLFFRSVEVVGRERIPSAGPVVLVANHTNGLVDPLLLLAVAPRTPRFLGKSTLWKSVLLRPFLRLAAVVPIHRQQDGPSTTGNDESLRVCRAVLASGGAVALFPEGISHDEPTLQPLKTGAARIALGAACDDMVPGVVVIPVAMIFDARARFRSRALVRVGAPITLDPFACLYQSDSRAAVVALTTEVEDRLRTLGPDYESWQQATELAAIAEILVGPAVGESGPAVALHERERLAGRLAALADDPGQGPAVAALRDAHARYRHDLALLGVDDAHVVAGFSRERSSWFGLGLVARLVLWLGPVTVGVAGNWLPYRAVGRLARIPRTEGMRATFKLLGSVVVFPVWWVGLGGLAWALVEWWIGVVIVVLVPLSGYVAVRGLERWRRFGGRVEARAIVHARRDVMGAVLAHRGEIFEAALSLPPDPSDGPTDSTARAAPPAQ